MAPKKSNASQGGFLPSRTEVERFKQSSWSGLTTLRRQGAEIWISADQSTWYLSYTGVHKRKVSFGERVVYNTEKGKDVPTKAGKMVAIPRQDLVKVDVPTTVPPSLEEWGITDLDRILVVEAAKRTLVLVFDSVELKELWFKALVALKQGVTLKAKSEGPASPSPKLSAPERPQQSSKATPTKPSPKPATPAKASTPAPPQATTDSGSPAKPLQAIVGAVEAKAPLPAESQPGTAPSPAGSASKRETSDQARKGRKAGKSSKGAAPKEERSGKAGARKRGKAEQDEGGSGEADQGVDTTAAPRPSPSPLKSAQSSEHQSSTEEDEDDTDEEGEEEKGAAAHASPSPSRTLWPEASPAAEATGRATPAGPPGGTPGKGGADPPTPELLSPLSPVGGTPGAAGARAAAGAAGADGGPDSPPYFPDDSPTHSASVMHAQPPSPQELGSPQPVVMSMAMTPTSSGLQVSAPLVSDSPTGLLLDGATGQQHLSVVVVGKTGNGKSATSNSLIGQPLFESKMGGSSVTVHCQSHTISYRDMTITVIDTPGMFDTTREAAEVEEEIRECIELAGTGISAILVVINPLNRFTQEEAHSVGVLERIFGERLMEYMGIVFTHGDRCTIDDLKTYLDTAPANLQQLLVRMGLGQRSRAVLVDNSLAGGSKVRLQQKLLVNLVLNVQSCNAGKLYSKADLERAHAQAVEQKEQEEARAQQELKHKEEAVRKAVEEHYNQKLDEVKQYLKEQVRREIEDLETVNQEQLKQEFSSKLAAAKSSIHAQAKEEIGSALEDLRRLHEPEDKENLCAIC